MDSVWYSDWPGLSPMTTCEPWGGGDCGCQACRNHLIDRWKSGFQKKIRSSVTIQE